MTTVSNFIIRSATSEDLPLLFSLIQTKAEFENVSHLVTGTAETLGSHLFSNPPRIEAVLAECEEKVVGFALFYQNYSTYLTRVGIHLDDLFVLAEYRKQGIGKALISAVGKIAVTRGYGRLEWGVAIWNENAIAFYTHLGASILEQRTCRVTGDSLINLASLSS